MLELKNLSFSYGNHSVLDNCALDIKSGKIHGLIGLNGEGKTTLLNLLIGRLIPDSGNILWNQQPLNFNLIGFLETETYFFPKITGKEFLQIFRFKNPKFEIGGWNQIFQLPLNELIESYSAGMKRKLAIISLMSLEVPILLLDEPFNNLDLETSLILEKLLIQVQSTGKTIIMTSHILDTLVESCDEIHHLNGMKIIRSYTKSEFSEIRDTLVSGKIQKSEEQIKSLIK